MIRWARSSLTYVLELHLLLILVSMLIMLKYSLESVFIDILNSIAVKQHVSRPTHCRNYTLDLIQLHGIDVSGVYILQQSGDISDPYLVLCIFHIAKAVKPTPCYKYGRTITFITNLHDLSQFLSISNSSEQLDDVT